MQKLTSLVVFGLIVGALTGCGDSSSPVQSVGLGPQWVEGTEADRAEVVAEATRHPEFMDEAVYESDLPMSDQLVSDDGRVSPLAAISPITFSRRVRVTDRSFEFAFADTDSVGRPTRAFLTVVKEMSGTFRIVAQDTTGSFNPPFTLRKELTETWTRRFEFARTPKDTTGDGGDDDDDDDDGGDDGGGHGHSVGRDVSFFGNGHGGGNGRGKGRNGSRWELVGVSAIEVDSPNGSVDIVDLRIQAEGIDTTITDALDLLDVEGLPTLSPGTEVTVSVTTNSPDDIVLLLSRDRRVRLHSDGGNTHSGTFIVPESFGCHHFGVNALSHDTLYDDEAPYDSQSWLFPIRAGNGLLGRR